MRVIWQSPDPLARMQTMIKRQGNSGAIDVKAVLAKGEEFLRALVRTALQEVLEADVTEALGAEKGERAPGRQGYPVGLLRPNAGRAGGQAGAAGAAGSNRAFLDRAIRTVSAFGAGAGGGDVRVRGFDPQSEGNHRGIVRPQLFGFVDQCNEPEAGCEPGAICQPPVMPQPSPI
jgi:hypothetical protein